VSVFAPAPPETTARRLLIGESAFAANRIRKTFGHVVALDDARIDVRAGEVVALFGDNGAGKSTLNKVLLGIEQPDAGTVEIAGEEVVLHSIRDAQARGLSAVHQDLALAPDLTVAENMFLGHELRAAGVRGRIGFLDRRAMTSQAATALEDLSIRLPSAAVDVKDLSGGQRQAVAVARAEMWAQVGILMDEPTAALGVKQSDNVCRIIRATAERGLGVLVVSHDIPRMLETADRIFILRRGRTVVECKPSETNLRDVVTAMVGAERHG